MVDELSPRARMILAAVEREAEARRRRLADGMPEPPARLTVDGALLAALELGVAGLVRDEVAHRLRADHGLAAPDRLLDAVFGPGSPPRARLRRLTSRR